MNGDLGERLRFEQRHAQAAAGDQDEARPQVIEQPASTGGEPVRIVADRRAGQCLGFLLVGCGAVEPGEAFEAVATVAHHVGGIGERPPDVVDELGSDAAVAVVAQHRHRGASLPALQLLTKAVQFRVAEDCPRLDIETRHLLLDRALVARHQPGLGRRGVAALGHEPLGCHADGVEAVAQPLARLVVTEDAEGERFTAEGTAAPEAASVASSA